MIRETITEVKWRIRQLEQRRPREAREWEDCPQES